MDTTVLRLVASSALQGILDKIIGPKTLVLAGNLAGQLGLVTEVGLLKGYGISKMFWLEPGPLAQAERNVVYLCRPEVKYMKIIAGQIKATPTTHNYTLLVVPRLTPVCTSILADLGVLGSLDVQEFQLGLIPLESDLLSLEGERAECWKKLELDGDYTPVYDMAKSLMTVQRAFGLIPRIVGKGDNAQRLAQLLPRLHRELPLATASTLEKSSDIEAMIVIDRQVDMVTPLCTQLTYLGLVDEVVGVNNAHVEVDPALLNPSSTGPSTPSSSTTSTFPSSTAPKKRKHHLSSSTDSLYADLRDRNFAIVGAVLNKTARRLNEDYEKRHLAKTTAELRAFVGGLGGLQSEHLSLRLHTGLTEQILAITATDEFNAALEVQQNLIAGVDIPAQETAIRELINQEVELKTVLRLLCLYSIISGGLKQKVLEDFKREILQTYGFQHLPLLLHLQTLNLLNKPPPTSTSSTKSPFALSRKPLRLVVDDVDEQDPRDIAYVFSGYAPLSVRLVQCAIAGLATGEKGKAWKSIEEVVKLLPGKWFDEEMEVRGSKNDGVLGRTQTQLSSPSTIIICFLGGITYAEISALRFLAAQTPDRNLLVATTSIVQGGTMIQMLQGGSRTAS
ncbi:putative ATP binding protein [Meredithblackwellia eburnea MCA 4105]